MSRRTGFVAAAGAIVLALGGFGAALVAVGVPASAQAVPTAVPTLPQVLPPIPAPQPPAQSEPVFELLAPTLYPNCGAAALLAFLPGSELAPPLPGPYVETQIYDVTGPLFVMCAAVPRPKTEYKCLLDAQQEAILNTLEANAAGTTVPLGLHPEGSLVEQTIVVENKLPLPSSTPAPVSVPDPGSLAVQFLVCSPIVEAGPPPGQYFPPITTPSNEPFTPGTSSYLPGTAGTTARTIGGYAGVTGSLPATPRPSTPIGEGVRFAAVWLLPLGLLGMFGYVGPALTRELPLPKP